MPLPVSWPNHVVTEELERVGVYLIEIFPDGQTRWGTEPLKEPYGGSFTMANEAAPGSGKMHIFQIRAILNILDMAGKISAVNERLYARIGECDDIPRRRHGDIDEQTARPN
jgi:hypothetical protein